MTTGFIYALPPAAIYYVFKRYMVGGLTAGAVKMPVGTVTSCQDLCSTNAINICVAASPDRNASRFDFATYPPVQRSLAADFLTPNFSRLT